MIINTLDETFSINHRLLLNVAESIFCNVLRSDPSLDIDDLYEKFVSRVSYFSPKEALDKYEQISHNLSFTDFNIGHKRQGGYGILLNTIIHHFESNNSNNNLFNAQLFSLISGTEHDPYIVSKPTLINLVKFIESNADLSKKSVVNALNDFNEAIDSIEDDTFVYISADESYYSRREGCFCLQEVMSNDQLLEKFRNLVLENNLTDLDEVEDIWFDEVMTSDEILTHLKEKYQDLNKDTKPVDSLYFENNYNIVTVLKNN